MKAKIISAIIGGTIPLLLPLFGIIVILATISDLTTDIPENKKLFDYAEYKNVFDELNIILNTTQLGSDNKEFFYALYINENGNTLPDEQTAKIYSDLILPLTDEESKDTYTILSTIFKRFETETGKPITAEIRQSILNVHTQILNFYNGFPLSPCAVAMYDFLNLKSQCTELVIPFQDTNKDYVYAVLDGVVIENTYTKEYGNVIKIKHGNGNISIYGYLEKGLPEVGANVKAGDIIGIVGDTGRATKKSLFFQVTDGINPVDLCQLYKEFNFECKSEVVE